MKIILVRHAESLKNAGLWRRGIKNRLSQNGEKQAKELAEKLKNINIDCIYCSPTIRCKQTLEEILKIRDDEMLIHLSKLIDQKRIDEDMEFFQKKIGLFLDDLKYDHSEEDVVLVISHMMTLGTLLSLLKKETRILENGEIVEIEVKKD
jgi:probable phosphoglycerate mutase